MDQNQLRVALIALDLTPNEFAILARVTSRAVGLWLNGERSVPGPASALLDLLVSLSPEQRLTYVRSKLQGEVKMRNGLYLITFQAIAGSGEGVLIVEDGLVYGSDSGGGKYDGTCDIDPATGLARLRLHCEMPANQPSVLGPIHPFPWAVNIEAFLDPRTDQGSVSVVTNIGRAEAQFRYMRSLPVAA